MIYTVSGLRGDVAVDVPVLATSKENARLYAEAEALLDNAFYAEPQKGQQIPTDRKDPA